MVQYSRQLDATFAALCDPTRRGILARLGKAEASITELADVFEMTLTGMKKHVALLEDAGLVDTEKVGRVRTCRLGSKRLDAESRFIGTYHRMMEERMEHLSKFLERTKGEPS